MRLLPFLAFGVLLALSALGAEPEKERAKVGAAIEGEKAKADAVEKERRDAAAQLKSIQRETTKAAADLQKAEQTLSDLEAELQALQSDIAASEATLKEDEAQLNQTLAALLRLSRRPPETALLEPGKVVDRLRTARLLGDLGRQVDEKASALRVRLDELAVLYAQTEQATARAEAATRALQGKQMEMAALLEKRQAAVKRLDRDLAARQRNIRNLMARAKSLDEVMAALALQRAAGLPHPRPDPLAPRTQAQSRRAGGGGSANLPKYISTSDFSQLRGRLVLPARGRVIGRFGSQSAQNATGLKGLEVATRPGAQVVIPTEGEILYSGPFRSYGGLLIVDVGRGYHMLIAGLDRIDAVVGQRLLAGEPVGAMASEGAGEPHKSQNLPQLSATDGSHLVKTGAGKSGARSAGANVSNPQLYFELRKGGKPIDPWPWLAPSEKR